MWFKVLFILCLINSVYSCNYNNTNNLQIYIFDVGQAMSQLWVYPDGYSIFIDGPEHNWNKDEVSNILSKKVYNILNTKRINVGVISHLHLDHLGMAGYGGIWALIEKYGFEFDKIIDRNSGYWDDKNKDCSEDNIKFNNIGTYSSTAIKWICYATNPNSKIYKIRENPKLCSDNQIKVLNRFYRNKVGLEYKEGTLNDFTNENKNENKNENNPGVNHYSIQNNYYKQNNQYSNQNQLISKITIVSADAYNVKMLDGRFVQGDHHNENNPPSENDYSIGLILQYGDFSFGTFGDLDGEYAKSPYNYYYDDIESSIIKNIIEVDAYNVNHHGSSHSSNLQFLQKLNPSVSFISCGKGNSYGHPGQDTLDRLKKVNTQIYLTENCNNTRNYYDSIITNSDIIITVSEDTKTYNVCYKNILVRNPTKNIFNFDTSGHQSKVSNNNCKTYKSKGYKELKCSL